jgi:hypothetical protein
MPVPQSLGALAGRGQPLAITLAEARLAQQAALKGDTQTVRFYQNKLRGAPGEIMADIAAAEAIPKALAAGDVAKAEQLQSHMTSFSIGPTEVKPIVEQAKQAIAAQQEAAEAASTMRTLLLAGAAGAIGLLTLYWVAAR